MKNILNQYKYLPLKAKTLLCFALLVVCFSCTSEQQTPIPNPSQPLVPSGSLELQFNNTVGDRDLTLETEIYTNHQNEPFSIYTLKYFVSNIILQKTDGTIFTIPQDSSYFLIDEADASKTKVLLSNIPEASYNKIWFNIGVDSLRSTMEPSRRTGALDIGGQALGMYWTWNSGYIHYKLEGESTAIQDGANTIQVHIGGFGGYSSRTDNNNRLIALDFPSAANVIIGRKAASVHIIHDILKTFNGPGVDMKFSERATFMSGEASALVANNYQKSFSIEKIVNQ